MRAGHIVSAIVADTRFFESRCVIVNCECVCIGQYYRLNMEYLPEGPNLINSLKVSDLVNGLKMCAFKRKHKIKFVLFISTVNVLNKFESEGSINDRTANSITFEFNCQS